MNKTDSFLAYLFFSIKRPRRLFKIRQFSPGVFSRPALNRGPAFVNEMRFSAIFQGLFIITDPRKLRCSLSMLEDFFAVQQLSQLCYAGIFPLNVY